MIFTASGGEFTVAAVAIEEGAALAGLDPHDPADEDRVGAKVDGVLQRADAAGQGAVQARPAFLVQRPAVGGEALVLGPAATEAAGDRVLIRAQIGDPEAAGAGHAC